MAKTTKLRCPKCGMKAEFDRRYIGSRTRLTLVSGYYVEGECILRTCEECGYEYSEKVADDQS